MASIGTNDTAIDLLRVRDIRVTDAGEVLTLQRAAFVDEARIYGSVELPAFAETLEQLQEDLQTNLGCVAHVGDRLVGALRAKRDGALLLIGRIAIAPDMQGQGIGSKLLDAAEARARALGCSDAELFTGSLSLANLRLYEHLGYRESERTSGEDGVEEVFLRKRL